MRADLDRIEREQVRNARHQLMAEMRLAVGWRGHVLGAIPVPRRMPVGATLGEQVRLYENAVAPTTHRGDRIRGSPNNQRTVDNATLAPPDLSEVGFGFGWSPPPQPPPDFELPDFGPVDTGSCLGKTFEIDLEPDNLRFCDREQNALLRNAPSCPAPYVHPRYPARLGDACCEGDRWQTDNKCNSQCSMDMISTEPNPNVEFRNARNTEMTAADRTYFNAIFNFIQENADICRWLVCLLEGPSNGDCIWRRLADPDNRQIIVFENPENPTPCGSDCSAWSNWATQNIHIQLDESWTGHRDRFIAALDSQDSGSALCLVVRDAHWLFHEMVHGCLSIINEQADDELRPTHCNCDSTDMAENSFLWAIGQRYPCLQDQDGCRQLTNDCYWMNPCDGAWPGESQLQNGEYVPGHHVGCTGDGSLDEAQEPGAAPPGGGGGGGGHSDVPNLGIPGTLDPRDSGMGDDDWLIIIDGVAIDAPQW
ncbi:MAG: hypothetical protein KC621_06245 [Myxococcales bacterium]|nr:hypothetical protein [Myxococcales bacterium]